MPSSKKHLFLFLFILICALATTGLLVYAATCEPPANGISSDPLEHWAYNNVIGDIDFSYYKNDPIGKVQVFDNKITGFASSSVGPIVLSCESTPNGNICGQPAPNGDIYDINRFITNDGGGNLSGWAWNDTIGWINFNCANPETGGASPNYSCTNSNYQVRIDSLGNFTGWAWNEIVGWISFNCANPETGGIPPNYSCANSTYKVKTCWQTQVASGTLLSSIMDASSAVAFNSIMWQGEGISGKVKFQFASDITADNPITFPAPLGPGGTVEPTDFYTAAQNTPMKLNVRHNNHRYYRYKIILESDASRTNSPIVENVIVNWSP